MFIVYRKFSRYLCTARISRVIFYLQESRKISSICINFASYIFLRISQDIYYLQEPSSTSNFPQETRSESIYCMNHERYLLFARIEQDGYILQKPCKISIKRRNLARDIILAIILHYMFSQKNCQYYLEESDKITVICKNIARYLFFSKI